VGGRGLGGVGHGGGVNVAMCAVVGGLWLLEREEVGGRLGVDDGAGDDDSGKHLLRYEPDGGDIVNLITSHRRSYRSPPRRQAASFRSEQHVVFRKGLGDSYLKTADGVALHSSYM
jgi:hypothetical protein